MNLYFQLQVIGEVLLAMFCGGVIGYDREQASKPAGLRTHMLVAGAAALLVGVSEVMVERATGVQGQPARTADPVRIVEAIITGVSFIGAGTILRHGHKERVEGLTTAAALLISAATGISVALRQFILAGGVTLLTLLVLRSLAALEQSLRKG
jgi:putative Mg2+ transporter-C (MgtC) family protein